MKKLFTPLACLFFAGILQAQSVFECKFSPENFEKWIVIDANDDQKTWELKASDETIYVAAYPYHGTNVADDWLISPTIKVEPNRYYKLSFKYQGSSYGEKMDVFCGTAPNVAAMTNLVVDLGEFKNGEAKEAQGLISANGSEAVYLGFHAKSDPDKFRIYLNDISLDPCSAIDISPREVLSPVTGFNLGEEQLTVRITNSGFEPVSNIPVCFSVNNGTPIREIITQSLAAGASVDYSFTARADLSAPRITHQIKVWTEVAEDAINLNDTCWAQVRHLSEARAPYFMGFEEDEETDQIATFNLNDDTGDWSLTKNSFFGYFANTGSYAMVYDYDKVNNGNDWFILEPIILEAGFYSLKFWYSGMGDHPERLAAYYGKEQKPEAMTNLIVEYDPFLTSEYLESASVFEIKEAGTYYFGFKAFSDKDENIICVDDISIEKVIPTQIDLAIGKLTNPSNGYIRSSNSKDIVFDIVNKGIAHAADAQVTVLLDNRQVFSQTVALAAQQTKTITVTDALKEMPKGLYQLHITIAHPNEDADKENNDLDATFRIVGDPVVMYDFEQGVIPNTFKLEVCDGAVINDQIADLFPKNEAWNLVEINEHQIYGNWMIASGSFFSTKQQADRWCILPEYKVSSPDACFIWTGVSMDATFPEDYEVLVSEEGDNLESFNTVATVKGENSTINPSTRGIELGAYAGKNIHVAFRLRTLDGYVLTLDNLGFYDADPSGITVKSIDGVEIRVIDNELIVTGMEVAGINLFNASGSVLLNGRENRLDLTALPSGVYLVEIKDFAGTRLIHRIVR
ncbi:MAG: choice-of-anchor J domain-containing protein [Bacteroidales bacterium]